MGNCAKLLAVAALAVAVCGGCGGGGEPVGTATVGTFTCDIDGQPFTGAFKWCRDRTGNLELWGATADEQKYIEIKVAKPTELPATIRLGDGHNTPGQGWAEWAMFDLDSNRTGGEFYTFGQSSGTVTIARLDATGCAGSFAFRGRNRDTGVETVITNGVFDVRYGGLPGW